jgi:hypothetical protein
MDLVTLTISMLLALVVGFAIQRGSVCCVAAAQQLVVHHRAQRTKAFLLAACWSAVVIVPLSWWIPGVVHLSPGYPVAPRVVAGAVIYGVGAYLNKACVFGTLSGLTRGQLRYVASMVGLVAGALAVALVDSPETAVGATLASPVSGVSLIAAAFWSAALLLVIRASYRHFRASRHRLPAWRELLAVNHWRPAVAMAVLGIAGGLLYATAGEWTYLAVLSDRSAALVRAGDATLGWAPFLVSAALVAGGVLAAVLSGRFAWQRGEPGMVLRRIAGGVLMSGSAAVLPGGNDALLLYGLPSAVPYAFVGYAVMILSLCAIIHALRWRN